MADATKIPVIFLAFANDRDDTVGYLRNLPAEARRLREVLDAATQAGLCDVVVRSNSTAGDIFKVFQDPQYRNRVGIFHYGGHANGYQLLLESAAGESAAADAGGLAAFLAQQRGLQLVVLNGCSTQQQTQGLLKANIPAVISTSRSIDDQVATDFAVQFYQGLAGGATIRTAYKEAAAAVQMAKGGNTRSLYFGDPKSDESQLEADRWPWNLYLREGSERADQWNLPEAVDEPLFGLPELPARDLPDSPYRYLNWFTRKDAEVFFGRGHQIRELYDRLTAPHTEPILLFYGQSGVGKSSILDAGLIPRLERDYEVRYARRTSDGLLATLRAALGAADDVTDEELAKESRDQLPASPVIALLDQLRERRSGSGNDAPPDELDKLLDALKAIFGNESHYLRDSANELLKNITYTRTPAALAATDAAVKALWHKQEQPPNKPLIVFLDQVEELYTHGNADASGELKKFLEALTTIFADPDQRPRGRLVLGFRKEWLAELETHLADYELPRTKVFLEPLDDRGIIEVVRGPTRSERLRNRYGLTVEDGLARIIADDLLEDRESAIAPTLQILLTKMWAKATGENEQHRHFSQALYQDLKRDGILLRDFLDQQIARLRDNEDHREAVKSGLLLDMLALHTTPLGTAGQCALENLQRQYKHMGDKLPDLLEQCQGLHLLTVAASSQDGSGKTTRLAHDTLAPLVRARFDESDLPGQRARRILDNRSVDWADNKVATPLDEADLGVVERGLNGTRTLNETEQRLLKASRANRAQRQRQRQRLKSLGLFAVVLIALAGAFGWYQFIQAEEQRRLADQGRRMLLAESHKKDALLGRVIIREVPGRPEGWTAMAADAIRYRVPQIHHNPDRSSDEETAAVAFGTMGRFVTGNDDNEVLLWAPDASGAMRATRVGTHEKFIWDVVYSADGGTIASSDDQGVVKIWNVNEEAKSTLRHELPHEEAEGAALRVRLSNDGSTAAVLTRKGEGDSAKRAVVVWRLGGDKALRDLIPGKESDQVMALALSPDGSQLLLGYRSGAVQLLSTSPGETAPVTLPADHETTVVQVTFDEHGSRMASADVDGNVWWGGQTDSNMLRDTETDPWPLALRLGKERIFVAGEDTIYIGDLTGEGNAPSVIPEFFNVNIKDADFDGDRLIVALEGRDEVSIWDLDRAPEPRLLEAEEGCTDRRAKDIAYLNDGQLLAAYQCGTLRLWSTLDAPGATGADTPQWTMRPARGLICEEGLPLCADPLTALAVSEDGKRYATAFRDGRITVGDIREGSQGVAPDVIQARSVMPGHENRKTCERRDENAPTDHVPDGNDVLNSAWSVAFDQTGERIVAGFQDGRVQIFDLQKRAWADVGDHDEAVCDVDWARDGSRIVSGSLDERTQVWNVSDGRPTGPPVVFEHASEVYSASFDAEGERVVTGARDLAVRVWGLGTRDNVSLKGHHQSVRAVTFSPDGEWVLSGGGDLVGLTCPETRSAESDAPCEQNSEMVLVNTPGFGFIRAVAVAPTEPQFAVVDETGELNVFRTDYKMALWQLQGYCLPVAKRLMLLGETSEQAQNGYDHCQGIVKICEQSSVDCERALATSRHLN